MLQIILKLESRIVDVETAFLHGDLEVEIYMDCPEGLEGGDKLKCLKLIKAILNRNSKGLSPYQAVRLNTWPCQKQQKK